MSSFEAVINLTASDQATPVVDAATKNILAQYRVMNKQTKAVTDSFRLQNQVLVATGNAFRSVAGVANTFMNVFTEFQTMQIRVTDANNQLILAQLNYNQVLAEQGPGTNEAIAASIQLQEAKTNVAQATQQETLGYIGMALQLGGAVSQVINAIPQFETLAAKIAAVTAATKALSAIPTPTNITTPNLSPTAGLTKTVNQIGTTAETGGAAAIGAGAAKLTPSLLSRLGTTATEVAPSGLAIGSAISLLSMMGQQQAGGGEVGEQPLSTGIDALVQVAGDIGNKIQGGFQTLSSDLSNMFGGGSSSQKSGTVQHVVTVKIQNATDNIVSTVENSMGIQQVMSSNH